MKINRNLIWTIAGIIAMIALVTAYNYQTTYNPFTGKQDYVVKYDQDLDTGDDVVFATLNTTGVMISEDNLSIVTDNYICLDNSTTCAKYITFNGTDIIIKNG